MSIKGSGSPEDQKIATSIPHERRSVPALLLFLIVADIFGWVWQGLGNAIRGVSETCCGLSVISGIVGVIISLYLWKKRNKLA